MVVASRWDTRFKIIRFLKSNKNQWFSQDAVVKALDRRYNLVSQLDSLVATRQGFYRDECIVKDRRKRLFYGYFDSKEKAAEIVPKIEFLRTRTLATQSLQKSSKRSLDSRV